MDSIGISLSQTLSGHRNPIYAVEKGTDMDTFFTAGGDRGVVEWDLRAGKFKRILCSVPASVYALHLIPDTALLAVAMRNGEVWIVDTESQALRKKLSVERGAVFAVRTLAHRQEILAIGEEGFAYVWSLETFELIYRFRVSDTTVRTAETDPAQARIAFGDRSGRIRLFSTADFREICHRPVHKLPVTALLATENALYSGGRDAQLYQLDQTDLNMRGHITPHMFTVYAILQHPQMPALITVSRDKSIKFWDRESLALLKNVSADRGFDVHRLSINAACLHGTQLLTVSDDKSVKVWELGQ